jgi:hypothetical protein
MPSTRQKPMATRWAPARAGRRRSCSFPSDLGGSYTGSSTEPYPVGPMAAHTGKGGREHRSLVVCKGPYSRGEETDAGPRKPLGHAATWK